MSSKIFSVGGIWAIGCMKTKLLFYLQKKKVYVPELKKSFNLTISTRALKTIQKRGAFATLKKAGII